jgi:hypothetical protein
MLSVIDILLYFNIFTHGSIYKIHLPKTYLNITKNTLDTLPDLGYYSY